MVTPGKIAQVESDRAHAAVPIGRNQLVEVAMAGADGHHSTGKIFRGQRARGGLHGDFLEIDRQNLPEGPHGAGQDHRGVDGEIARATFRTSRFGAAADSLVDAASNLAFIGGVVANLWLAQEVQAAVIGAIGLGEMALGLFLLGLAARRGGGNITFDLVKHRFGKRPSWLRTWLTWLTMRDFYALAGFGFVASGNAGTGLVAFAVVATGWLVVVLAVLAGRRRKFGPAFIPAGRPAGCSAHR